MIRLHHSSSSHVLIGGQYWQPPKAPEDKTYRDTPASVQQVIIAAIRSGTPWREAVASHYKAGSPWLYRIVTDPSRDLFFRQYPPTPKSTILDIGAGWGQMALPLAREHTVVALEPTPERLEFIHAVAHQEKLLERLICVQSDFLDVEFEAVFDMICCIGVLEWVPKFRPGEPVGLQRSFLTRMRAALKPGGKVVVGIENRLGLKYLLGSSDDHIGSPNIAVLDGALANKRFKAITGNDLRSFTHTMAEYKALFAEAGYTQLRAYAAFPDYKVPEIIMPADDRLELALSGKMAIPPEHDGSSGERLAPDFQETLRSHYQSLARNGICRYFAPSYFLEAWGE
jgi:2-polyprenyl-3-methyl-5-hydroxy-6-metoxy-1,4-benzoquinol methylase